MDSATEVIMILRPSAGWGPPRPRRCSPTSFIRTWTPIALILSAAAGAPLLAAERGPVMVGCAVRTIQDESSLFIAPRLNGAWNAPYARCKTSLASVSPLWRNRDLPRLKRYAAKASMRAKPSNTNVLHCRRPDRGRHTHRHRPSSHSARNFPGTYA
jgi:hypothetical protein